jgi:hypothetical protein
MGELLIGLTKYFAFYNGERPHQGWEIKRPMRCMLTPVEVGQ